MIRLALATVFVLTVVGLVPGPVSAGETDSTTFRVQDYIPGRYADFSWRLNGATMLSDAIRETPAIRYDDAERERTDYSRESSGQQLDLTNSWRYRFETRQGFTNYSLRLQVGLLHRNSQTYDSTVNSPLLALIRRSEKPVNESSFYIPLTGESRRYLVADAFVAVEGTFQYWYDQEDTREVQALHTAEEVDSTSGWIEVYDELSNDHTTLVSRRIDFTGEIRIGWGRVYEGRYAATAINVVDELQRSALLLRQPDRNEMLELTRMIHGYLEGHYWDRREFRAATIRALLDALHDTGIIADLNTAAVLCLEDVLDYFPKRERRFGWDVQAGFGGHDKYQNTQNGYERKRWVTIGRMNPDSSFLVDTVSVAYARSAASKGTKNFVPADHIIVRLGYHRPLSARWQFDLTGSTWFYLNRNTNGESIPNQSGYRYERSFGRRVVYVETAFQYLHDGRTSLTAGASLIDTARTDRYWDYFSPHGRYLFTVDWKEHRRWFGLEITADYRLSPSTTLSLDWTTSRYFTSTRREDQYREERNNSNAFSAGITHWLF